MNIKVLAGIFKFSNWLIIPLIFFSCGSSSSGSNEKPLAKVGDSYLYPSDMKMSLPSSNGLKQDSAEAAKKYVNNWVREMLLLQKAENNLTDDKKKFDKMVEDYRKSLITYQYESELVKQK